VKIAVLTTQWGNLPYFPYSSRINAAYCRRYGYEFLIESPRDDWIGDRNPIWCKVLRAAQHLPENDYLLFLDADAWFHDHSKSIEQFIAEQFDSRTLMVLGTDRTSREFAWSDEDANTGVWVVRNTPLMQHILWEWWYVPIYDPRCAHDWPIGNSSAVCKMLAGQGRQFAGLEVGS